MAQETAELPPGETVAPASRTGSVRVELIPDDAGFGFIEHARNRDVLRQIDRCADLQRDRSIVMRHRGVAEIKSRARSAPAGRLGFPDTVRTSLQNPFSARWFPSSFDSANDSNV